MPTARPLHLPTLLATLTLAGPALAQGDWSLGPELRLTGNALSFGASVASDDARLVVGAPFAQQSGFVDAGTVFVRVRGAGAWPQEAQLSPWDLVGAPQAQWHFGQAAAIEGDLLAVGAPNHDGLCPSQFFCDSGAVYVFRLLGGQWTQEQFVVPAGLDSGDHFGAQVVLADGQLLVAAPRDDDGGTLCGAVYVFERIAGTWSQVDKLLPSDARSYIGFGTSMRADGDVVVVGAPSHPHAGANGADYGRAYVLRRVAGTWSEEAVLDADNYHADMYLGSAVDVSGDSIAVGASGRHVNNTHDGAVYTFERQAGTWVRTQRLDLTGTLANENFGCALALDGERMIVGKDRVPTNIPDDVQLYERTGGTWNRVLGIRPAAPYPANYIGRVMTMTEGTLFFGSLAAAYVFEMEPHFTAFCDPLPNSTGGTGDLTASGTPFLSANDLSLVASGLPNGQFGYFLVADLVNPTGVVPGGSSGLLCLAGSIGRFNGPGQILTTGSTGSFSLPVNLTSVPSASGPFTAILGDVLHFQAWHRDQVGVPTSNFTSGLRMTVR